ncbi:MAG: exodeoxyribonuclease VII large subunit [Candidatus Endonucleobacter bathymodioli]|uniref:Exodeoxyribonuclease 7 large subunit n=1 Tax=Candidatus Endonucleibacter bathymodioli TaxID=539814 RepID=A0AA90SCP9_9GAMM|nr:exodeoxyribonuclease VII large subunit [Candidatus Endonucleobacter bathymodioli]
MHSYLIEKPINAQILSVTELNNQARLLLEMNFCNIRVEGEISGLTKPSSGHSYFTLKDEQAKIRCAMFRNRKQSLRFTPSEGMQVQVRGQVGLYTTRGDYQLIIEHMEEAGSGALQKAFEALKNKLASEGLFDNIRKQQLPAYPKHIGVITSPTGAAIRDILSILKRRSPFIPVTIIPSMVQGSEAKEQLINSLKISKKINCDVIIISRGGGSIEDLWSFNEEAVVRAVAKHPVPIVSGVGHETDFTIVDLVADYRAPTPSAAAEILSPDKKTLLETVSSFTEKITALTLHNLLMSNQQVNHISKRLRHPSDRLRKHAQRLDDLEIRMSQAIRLLIEKKKCALQQYLHRLQQHSPLAIIARIKSNINHQSILLQKLTTQNIICKQTLLRHTANQLHAVSPLATLARGYSITRKDQEIVTDIKQLQAGDKITTLFHRGSASCTVDSTFRK